MAMLKNHQKHQWTGKLVWNVSILVLAVIFILLTHVLVR